MKDKIVPVDALKACGGTGGIAPFILNLGARQSYVLNNTPRPLHAEERMPVPPEFEAFVSVFRNLNLSYLVIKTFINYSALLGA